jgi:hypothetical protein
MVFANAAQDTVTHLYNFGLSDAGDVVIHNEKGPGGTEVSITRDDDATTTLYEFAFPAASLGLDGYESGMSIGVGLCVNDGDTQDGQNGQKGWSGWGPYAAVYGKTASATGLVSLVGEPGGASANLVANGSFEADDVPEWPGYGAITAWTGGSGINDGGPFGDNGVIPDGAKLGFIQGTKALSQQLTGLEAGAEYVLAFYYNARNCCGGTTGFTVSVGGEELGSVSDVEPVGGENAYNSASYNFVAAGTEAELVFSATAAGDATLLLDAVSVSKAGAGGGDAPALSIANNGDGTVTVTFEGKLQAAASVDGPWADVDAASPLTIDASEAMQYARAVNE